MDDIQTILYIGVAVLYILSRVLKKKKPPPVEEHEEMESMESGPEMETAPPSKPPITFQDLLKDFEVQAKPKKQEKVEPTPPPVPQVKDEVVKATFERSIEAAKKVKKFDIQGDLKNFAFEAYEIEEKGEGKAAELVEMLRNPQDIKNAIILKEILKTKF